MKYLLFPAIIFSTLVLQAQTTHILECENLAKKKIQIKYITTEIKKENKPPTVEAVLESFTVGGKEVKNAVLRVRDNVMQLQLLSGAIYEAKDSVVTQTNIYDEPKTISCGNSGNPSVTAADTTTTAKATVEAPAASEEKKD